VDDRLLERLGARVTETAMDEDTAPPSTGAAQVTLPALEVAPPDIFWRKERSPSTFHHTVYATATGVAYELLEGPGPRTRLAGSA